MERKLSGINRELKEMGPQADGGGERQLENNKYPQMSQMDTDGGPQADCLGESESSEFKRNLNGGPQADGGGERQLENNKYPQMSQMDTD